MLYIDNAVVCHVIAQFINHNVMVNIICVSFQFQSVKVGREYFIEEKFCRRECLCILEDDRRCVNGDHSLQSDVERN